MTNKTFTLDNLTCRIGADGKVLTKVSFGPDSWGAEAWVPYPVSGEEADLTFKGDFPKIPFDQILFVREFFAEAYKVHQTEAFVYFSANYEEGTYDIVVPPRQEATSGHVSYAAQLPWFCSECGVGDDRLEEPGVCVACGATGKMKKTRVVGTAHSHGSMAAFHSATDDANELGTTGFHITFGRVDRELLEIAHSYVVAKRGLLDGKGQGIRYKGNLDVGELIDIPFVSERPRLRLWTSLIVSQVALKNLKDDNLLLVRSSPAGYDLLSMSGDLAHYSRIKASMVRTGGVHEILEMPAGRYKKVSQAAAEEQRKKLAKSRSPVGLVQSKPLVPQASSAKQAGSSPTYLRSFSPTPVKATGPGLKPDPLLEDPVAPWAKHALAAYKEPSPVTAWAGVVRKDMLTVRCSVLGYLYPSTDDTDLLAEELGVMVEKLDPAGRGGYLMRMFGELLAWSEEALTQVGTANKDIINWLRELTDEAPDWAYDDVEFPGVDMYTSIYEGLAGRDPETPGDVDEALTWFDVLEPICAIQELLFTYSTAFPKVWAEQYLADLKQASIAITQEACKK